MGPSASPEKGNPLLGYLSPLVSIGCPPAPNQITELFLHRWSDKRRRALVSVRGKDNGREDDYESTLGFSLLGRMLMSLANVRKYICHGYRFPRGHRAPGHTQTGDRGFARPCVPGLVKRGPWGGGGGPTDEGGLVGGPLLTARLLSSQRAQYSCYRLEQLRT